MMPDRGLKSPTGIDSQLSLLNVVLEAGTHPNPLDVSTLSHSQALSRPTTFTVSPLFSVVVVGNSIPGPSLNASGPVSSTMKGAMVGVGIGVRIIIGFVVGMVIGIVVVLAADPFSDFSVS